MTGTPKKRTPFNKQHLVHGWQLVLAAATLGAALKLEHTLLICIALALLLCSAAAWLLAKNTENASLDSLHQWLDARSAGETPTEPSTEKVALLAQRIDPLIAEQTTQSNSDSTQTSTLLTETRSLGVLYEIAASVNVSRTIDELLNRALGAISKIVDTRAVAVRLLDANNQLSLAAHVGLDDAIDHAVHAVPIKGTSSGTAITERRVVWQDNTQTFTLGAAKTLMRENPNLLMVSIPLQNRETTVGVCNVFVDKRQIDDRDSIEALFLSIGRHLGIAIEKNRLEREAYHLHIMQERSRFSAELHDSLAQTLVSLRFQVKVLEDGLDNDNMPQARSMLTRIESAVSDANTELRELIAHFRAPIDRRGLMPAIKTAVDRFREETEVAIFIQSEWPDTPLDAAQELHVLRIIQESLSNIRKYANATAVRVFLSTENEHLKMVVEDDGVGFDPSEKRIGLAGNHIGLGIMKSRAEQLRGELNIDSEPGEGTRVLLKFLPRSTGMVDDSVFPS